MGCRGQQQCMPCSLLSDKSHPSLPMHTHRSRGRRHRSRRRESCVKNARGVGDRRGDGNSAGERGGELVLDAHLRKLLLGLVEEIDLELDHAGGRALDQSAVDAHLEVGEEGALSVSGPQRSNGCRSV